MLGRVKQCELEGALDTGWQSLTSREQNLIRLFRQMPEHEQKRVLWVSEVLVLSNPYSPVWSVTEKI